MDSTTVATWSKFGMDKINDLIDAVKLAAPKLWEIYLRQVTVEAWVGLIAPTILFVIFAPIFFARYYAGRRNYLAAKLDDRYARWSEGDRSWCILFAALSIIAFVCAVVLGIRGAMVLNNPEYYAIQMLLGR